MIDIAVQSVRNPEFIDENGARINCIVKFSHLKEECEFTATIYDVEQHGRDIWLQCINGTYGEVKSYQPEKYALSSSDQEIALVENYSDLQRFIDLINDEVKKKSLCYSIY